MWCHSCSVGWGCPMCTPWPLVCTNRAGGWGVDGHGGPHSAAAATALHCGKCHKVPLCPLSTPWPNSAGGHCGHMQGMPMGKTMPKGGALASWVPCVPGCSPQPPAAPQLNVGVPASHHQKPPLAVWPLAMPQGGFAKWVPLPQMLCGCAMGSSAPHLLGWWRKAKWPQCHFGPQAPSGATHTHGGLVGTHRCMCCAHLCLGGGCTGAWPAQWGFVQHPASGV